MFENCVQGNNSFKTYNHNLIVILTFHTIGDCVDLDLGMENGAIPDSKITSSSVQNASTPANNGRLNYTSGSSWCAVTSDTNPYLQIDLQTLHIICAVSTQGNSQADQWVKNYILQVSTDGTTWKDYKEGGQLKVTICELFFVCSEMKEMVDAFVLVIALLFLLLHESG